jgi:hypothetical protein
VVEKERVNAVFRLNEQVGPCWTARSLQKETASVQASIPTVRGRWGKCSPRVLNCGMVSYCDFLSSRASVADGLLRPT